MLHRLNFLQKCLQGGSSDPVNMFETFELFSIILSIIFFNFLAKLFHILGYLFHILSYFFDVLLDAVDIL